MDSDCQPNGLSPVVRTERTYYDPNALMREIYVLGSGPGHWRHSMMHGAQIGRKIAKHVGQLFRQQRDSFDSEASTPHAGVELHRALNTNLEVGECLRRIRTYQIE